MPRIPLLAAVVGALLIGGATTGVTRASWVDQESLGQSAAHAGRLDFGAATASGPLAVTRGQSATRIITVTDDSLGRNLTRRITPSVTTDPAITATLYTVADGACTTTPASSFTGALGGSFSLCLSVTAPTGSTATSATATVALTGQQTRNGADAGWSRTRTVPVSVTIHDAAQAPVRPQLSCEIRNGNDVPVSWSMVTGETYTVEVSTSSATAGYAVMSTSATSPYLVGMGTNNTTRWIRVKSTVGSASSTYSNVLRVSQGNGAASITCGQVSP